MSELKRDSVGKKLGTGAAILAVVAILLALLSVGFKGEYTIAPVALGDDYERRILDAEASENPIPGTEKKFDWRNPDRAKTPYALVQLHGWSATRQEISPVGETLALTLGMNLFMTRFCGHGLGREGMGKVTAECLLRDGEEALAVGKKMGEKVVLMGMSTGAAVALEVAHRHPNDVAAVILLAPNFRPKDPMSLLLKGPVGRWIAKYYVREHSWTPKSEDEAKYWTTSYSAEALTELMNMLSWTNRLLMSSMKMPMIMFISENDQVLSVPPMKRAFERWGGPKELVAVPNSTHLLAGDIHNPSGTPLVVARAKSFLSRELGIATAESAQDPSVPAQDE